MQFKIFVVVFCRNQKLNTTAIVIKDIESEGSSTEGLKNYYDFESHSEATLSTDEEKQNVKQ